MHIFEVEDFTLKMTAFKDGLLSLSQTGLHCHLSPTSSDPLGVTPEGVAQVRQATGAS